MSERIDPGTIFEDATTGLMTVYFGHDDMGTDMWEYAFTPEELEKVNTILDEYEVMPTERIVIGRSNTLSTMENTGLFRPGEDTVSFQLQFGGLERYFSFRKTEPMDESMEEASDIVIVEKGVYGGDIMTDLQQENQITTPEMLALSAIAKMLPGNRDSA
jgi:hypothetical protein